MKIQEVLDAALWLAGAAHFVILIAGSQVPYRLHWKEDLAKLQPFNRKLLWTYWAFTGGTIVAFGVLTLALHGEMLRGERPALALAVFIGLFWLARIVVDSFYFRHQDWPEGRQFVVGHVLLTLLFVCLAATYLGLVAWHTVWG